LYRLYVKNFFRPIYGYFWPLATSHLRSMFLCYSNLFVVLCAELSSHLLYCVYRRGLPRRILGGLSVTPISSTHRCCTAIRQFSMKLVTLVIFQPFLSFLRSLIMSVLTCNQKQFFLCQHDWCTNNAHTKANEPLSIKHWLSERWRWSRFCMLYRASQWTHQIRVHITASFSNTMSAPCLRHRRPWELFVVRFILSQSSVFLSFITQLCDLWTYGPYIELSVHKPSR